MTPPKAAKGWVVVDRRGRFHVSGIAKTKAKAIEKFGVEFDGYAPNGWTAIANGKAPDGYRCLPCTITVSEDER